MSLFNTCLIQNLFGVVAKRATVLVSLPIAEPSRQGPSSELYEGSWNHKKQRRRCPKEQRIFLPATSGLFGPDKSKAQNKKTQASRLRDRFRRNRRTGSQMRGPNLLRKEVQVSLEDL